MDPEGAALIGELVTAVMRGHGLKHVGGPEMGAMPILACVAATRLGYPARAFLVRRKPKEHGAKQQIDGYVPEGGEALIVDDLTTTDGSTLQAVDAVADRCSIRLALSIVDREEGANEAMSARNIRLLSLFRRSDFGL